MPAWTLIREGEIPGLPPPPPERFPQKGKLGSHFSLHYLQPAGSQALGIRFLRPSFDQAQALS